MSSRIKRSLLALVMLISTNILHADDLQILNTQILKDANVLFVMDLSGSMNYDISGTSDKRLDVLSDAFQAILLNPKFKDINIGLTTFSGKGQDRRGAGKAHGIAYPVSPMIGELAQDNLSKPGFIHPDNSFMPKADSDESREYLKKLSKDKEFWEAAGSTPIVDALYEASLYFRGQEVDLGKFDASDIRSAHPATYSGSLTTTSSTVTPACTIETREECVQGSCGATEGNCSSNTEWVNNDIDAGGCTLVTGNREACPITNPSCGANCADTTVTKNRFCYDSADVAACGTDNGWYNCVAFTHTTTTTNSEEQTVTTSSSAVRCKEDVTTRMCDAPDTYSCPIVTVMCDKCPEDEIVDTTNGNAIYKSPIIEECATNAIILLSDGAPTSNNSADKVASLIGATYTNDCNTSTNDDGRCGPELAGFMASVDHADGSTSLPNINGAQNVKTYAIGLDLDEDDDDELAAINYLNAISMAGNDKPAIIAGSEAELVKAFIDTIDDSVAKARSFSSPSYSVDKATSLTNGPYVYIPVFDQGTGLWPGNLKKFKFVNGVMLDANDDPALDADKALLATAQDLWSSVASTDVITSGGAANNIDPKKRREGKMITNVGGALDTLDNAANDDFGTGTTDDEKKDLIKFISGTNPDDGESRNHMGDIIHSKPVQIQLASGRKIILVGTNEGFLHAFNDYAADDNSKNGTEAFAYMPKELLKNIKPQYEGTTLPSHIYGVDGLITTWIDESANSTYSEKGNNIVDVANGDKGYVFFGLRRGGSSYTALEVTNPDSPRLVWSKSFGTGDSWSQPVVANLKWGSPTATERPVLVIGGGFNDDTTGTELAGGNNVYIVNALSGDIVWDTSDAFSGTSLVTNYTGSTTSPNLPSATQLPNAVPARIRTIDLDGDNSIDRLYFGDTGGNIWRADLNAANMDAITTNDNDISKTTLHRFAELGGTGVNNRKFFEEPDIAIYKSNGKLVTSIAIGSGDRPNPLSATTEDKFFVLYDKEVAGLPTEAQITLASGNVKTVPVSISESSAADYKGWQKSLDTATGEKILSSAVTFQGKVIFTSFATLSITITECSPSNTNQNKLYVVDMNKGIEDGVFSLEGGEILATPKIVYPGGGTCVVGDCKRDPKIGVGRTVIDLPSPKDVDGTPLPNPTVGKALERVYWINSNE